MANPDVTRVNANVANGIRSDVFLNPVYEEGCIPSKTDANKTVEGGADVDPDPVKSGGQNPMHMPNVPQQAPCKSTGICIAVMIIAAMLAMAMLIVGTLLYIQKSTKPVAGTTYTPGQPVVGTTYTNGHPAVDTTYTLGRTDVMTSSTIFYHPNILPLDPTGPKRKESNNGVKTSASSIQKENDQDAECDPGSNIAPCCSPGNWCGNTADHCDCPGCVDYRNMRGAEHSGYTNEYYNVFAELMTYEAAKQTCVSHGGHLADVKTQELHDFILSKIQKVDRGRDYWIGLNDLTVENSWTWSDGTSVSDGVFTNWAPGEPNNGAGNGQDCGKLWEKEDKTVGQVYFNSYQRRGSIPAHAREIRRVLVASMDFRALRVRPRIFPYTPGFVLAVHVHGNLRPAHLACVGERLTIRGQHRNEPANRQEEGLSESSEKKERKATAVTQKRARLEANRQTAHPGSDLKARAPTTQAGPAALPPGVHPAPSMPLRPDCDHNRHQHHAIPQTDMGQFVLPG
ncbi:hypothetical protein Bbelb_155010 [Branchiostoma belcheri]|nr:hypothetical protein Bbelb_155010 [Branchiostoma belcheri]